MPMLLKKCLAVFVASACTWILAASAGRLEPDDAAGIEQAIRSQLRAISDGDAARAFSFTTPSIQAQMGNAENFYRLIREEYSPIFHHLVVIFSAPERLGDSVIQAVRLTDGDSRVWLALYSMQRDERGSWQIDGCQLLETGNFSV